MIQCVCDIPWQWWPTLNGSAGLQNPMALTTSDTRRRIALKSWMASVPKSTPQDTASTLSGDTLIHAAKQGHTSTASYLLEHGTDVYALLGGFTTILNMICCLTDFKRKPPSWTR